MKVESWQGINGKLVHDEQKAIVVDDDQALTDQKQLQEILRQDGQPIDEVRQAMIKKQTVGVDYFVNLLERI